MTVIVVDPLTVPDLAVTVVVPGAIAVNIPAALTVPIAGALDVHEKLVANGCDC